MIQLNPDRIVTVELTPKEQKTILNYCNIDRDIYSKISDSKDGVIVVIYSHIQVRQGESYNV